MTGSADARWDDIRARVRKVLRDQQAQRTTDDGNPWRDPQQYEIDSLHYRTVETLAAARTFQRALFDAGLSGVATPAEYGGQGLPDEAELAVYDELAPYDVPRITFGVGFNMVRHVLVAHGSDRQCRRHIPAILRGDEIWCQLFSEPDAGSDLAGLTTSADLDGDEYVITGSKIWSSGAVHADFGLLLARTDPDVSKHAGITAMILDMNQPSIEVRPLRQATGTFHFNIVHFDGARVPVDNVIGAPGDGWTIARTTLGRERQGGATARADLFQPVLDQARTTGKSGDPVVRDRLANLWIEARLVRLLTDHLRASSSALPNGSSLVKLANVRLNQRAALLGAQLCGPSAQAWTASNDAGSSWSAAVMASRRLSIAGGTDQIQRNVIGERALGLPREPAGGDTPGHRHGADPAARRNRIKDTRS